MKAHLTSFNKLGVNPMVSRVLQAIPGVHFYVMEESDVVFLVFIAPSGDFILDADALGQLAECKLPVIIFDYTETFPQDFFLGVIPLPDTSPYKPVDAVLRALPIKAYFKREMTPGAQVTGLPFPIYPIDWTLNVVNCGPLTIDTEKEYNNRPIDIFMSWGYSSESRPKLMGELLRRAGAFNAHFAVTEEDLNHALMEGRERIFALLFTPHYRRIHISKLLEWQAKAKISISMFGAGKKCFRHAEASYNSLMAHQQPDAVEWSYQWIPGKNCLQLPDGEKFIETQFITEECVAVNWLYDALRIEQGKLYPMYVNCVLNNRNYHNNAYARDYLLPKIVKALS